MVNYKRGNITTLLLPIMFMIIMTIIISFIFVYVQISVYLYDLKTSVFYIVKSSVSQFDYENIAYRDYKVDNQEMINKINVLLKKNYLRGAKKGITELECYNIKIITKKQEITEHTKNRYITPVICIKYSVRFNPLMSALGECVEINMHDDIKLSLLEFK